MRVASFNMAEPGSDRVRVAIAAEIGEPAREPAEWQTGILVLDKNDKVADRTGQTLHAAFPCPDLVL
jgi:hypothetical protein